MNNKLEKIGSYKIIQIIGSGGFGAVYLVEKGNACFALKKLLKTTEFTIEKFFKEAINVDNLRKKYNLEYVVKIEDVLINENAYVMEYLPMGSIEYMQKQKNDDFLVSLIQGLNELHKLNVAHRDIKPENIRARQDTPVIIDFGIASWWDSMTMGMMPCAGSFIYAPPEFKELYCKLHPKLKAVNEAAAALVRLSGSNLKEKRQNFRKLYDVYSLGITIGELCTGAIPFSEKDLEDLIEYLDKGTSKAFDNWLKKIPEKFRGFVKDATTFDPLKRPFLHQLIDTYFKKESIKVTLMESLTDSLDLEMEMPYICLDCGAKTKPPANYCSECGANLKYMGFHIIPKSQRIIINKVLNSVKLIDSPFHPVFSDYLTIFVDLLSDDFQAIIGRDEKKADIVFQDDFCLSRVQGRIEKKEREVKYFDKENPTNPSKYNNFPLDAAGIKLDCGGELKIGSSLIIIKKYFTEKNLLKDGEI